MEPASGDAAGHTAADAAGAVDACVAELARRAGVEPPVAKVRASRSVAYVRRGRGGRPVLVLDPSVPAAGARVLRAVVAHELGHLAGGHQADARRRLLAMVVGAVVCGATAYALSGRMLVGACVALVAAALGTLAALGRLRRHELAADATAAGLLGEIGATLETLAWLDEAHPRPVRRPAWLTHLLDDHPTRATRAAALRARALPALQQLRPPRHGPRRAPGRPSNRPTGSPEQFKRPGHVTRPW